MAHRYSRTLSKAITAAMLIAERLPAISHGDIFPADPNPPAPSYAGDPGDPEARSVSMHGAHVRVTTRERARRFSVHLSGGFNAALGDAPREEAQAELERIASELPYITRATLAVDERTPGASSYDVDCEVDGGWQQSGGKR